MYSRGSYNSREYENRFSVYGEIIEFGSYEQDNNIDNGKEAMKWVVLKTENGKSLILNLYILENLQFANADIGELFPWKDSDLRNYLNEDFLEKSFTEKEKSAILTSKIFADEIYSNDKIFILNKDEIEVFLKTAEDKKTSSTPYSIDQYNYISMISSSHAWWLRNEGYSSMYRYSVGGDGHYYENPETSVKGVRPALWLDSKFIENLYSKNG